MDTDRKEADMGYVKDFVGLIAQALVDASELPKQIEAIRSDMAGLTADLERTKARNVELDTMLNDTRRQRDEAEQALSTAKHEAEEAKRSLENANHGLSHQAETIKSLEDKVATLTKDRDDYGLKHMAAEDRANEAEGKLKKLREALGMPEEARPEPSTQPEPMPVNVPQAPPTPQSEPKKVYEGDWGFNELSHSTEKWDNTKQRYYRTV